MSPTLVLLMACSLPPSEAEAYARALEQVSVEPEQAAVICSALEDGPLRSDCVCAAAETLVATAPDEAHGLCESLEEGLFRDECLFQIAERSGQMTRCDEAGRFSMDCRMHLWSSSLAGLLEDRLPGQFEADLERTMAEAGFSGDDQNPWVAAYRHTLSRSLPLDRGACDQIDRPDLVEVCRVAGGDLYRDRLNRARDMGQVPCEGGPWPRTLAVVESDRELTELRDRRKSLDLCSEPGSSRGRPPPVEPGR